jgi:hypothetical protein
VVVASKPVGQRFSPWERAGAHGRGSQGGSPDQLREVETWREALRWVLDGGARFGREVIWGRFAAVGGAALATRACAARQAVTAHSVPCVGDGFGAETHGHGRDEQSLILSAICIFRPFVCCISWKHPLFRLAIHCSVRQAA